MKTLKLNLCHFRQLLFALMILFLAGGCKSEPPVTPDEAYFIEAKVDGVLFRIVAELPGLVTAQWNSLADTSYISAAAGFLDASQADRNYLGVNVIVPRDSLKLNIPYVTGPSSLPDAVQSNATSFAYFDDQGTSYVCNGLSDQLGLPSDGVVRFTEVTPDHLRGNFSGKYYLDMSGFPRVITEGKFFVKRVD